MPPRRVGVRSVKSTITGEQDELAAKPANNTVNESAVSLVISPEALKAAIWYTVAQIVQEEEIDLQRSATEPFVASLTELVYAQCETLALDLKAFAAHANRSTIRAEDVKLMARKTPELQDRIREELERYERASTVDKGPKAKNPFNPPGRAKSGPSTGPVS
ncbi:hypothetical protein CROQUDRAFT_57494 [Cronartium quercuum f. sp. fusiforme G11]|uniref:Centromere protein S n=1 Tax=Cronartium quercuum f. sp. fusiforme G11 TaxID=708437 RepID=A0A9P6NV00_9BASI|nr:hypothetical protein CROQUDRAFT_57494 [Cronartium quercuum f. sp. fusiforme G11]